MFEGTRLSYVVPGYTGHIPKNVYEQGDAYADIKPTNHIPGYAGYIQSMKSENLFSKTYGKTTYAIQHKDYHQGQDVPPVIRYKSHLQDTFQNQNNVQLRSAAEIVGVPQRHYIYPIPDNDNARTFFQADEFGQSKLLSQTQKSNHSNNFQDTQYNGDNQLRLGTPLPGYTGTQKRVVAANIFGQTFANTRKSAMEDESKIQHDRRQNFSQQSKNTPPLRR